MDKVKFLPLGLFIAFAGKMLLLPFAWTDVATLLIVGTAAFLYDQKSSNKQLQLLTERVEKNDQLFKEMKYEMESAKASIAGTKLSSLGNKRTF